MLRKFWSFLLVGSLSVIGTVGLANAALIDFDTVSTAFRVTTVTEDTFNIGRTHDGMGTLGTTTPGSYWTGNGTGRLLTWTNHGYQSGFSLRNSNNDLFSLESFDFANGYVNGRSPVSSVTLIGYFGGGGSISTYIRNYSSGWQTASLSNRWVGLQSVRFIANGNYNRAMWDNITVNESAVPEPTTLLLFGSGLAGLVVMKRQKRK